MRDYSLLLEFKFLKDIRLQYFDAVRRLFYQDLFLVQYLRYLDDFDVRIRFKSADQQILKDLVCFIGVSRIVVSFRRVLSRNFEQ